jgi:hypothetical protein
MCYLAARRVEDMAIRRCPEGGGWEKTLKRGVGRKASYVGKIFLQQI